LGTDRQTFLRGKTMAANAGVWNHLFAFLFSLILCFSSHWSDLTVSHEKEENTEKIEPRFDYLNSVGSKKRGDKRVEFIFTFWRAHGYDCLQVCYLKKEFFYKKHT